MLAFVPCAGATAARGCARKSGAWSSGATRLRCAAKSHGDVTHSVVHGSKRVAAGCAAIAVTAADSLRRIASEVLTRRDPGSMVLAAVAALYALVLMLAISAIAKRFRRAQFVERASKRRELAESINPKIAQFYDVRSDLWEKAWGSDDMHHGFYGLGKDLNPRKDRFVAQHDMMKQLLEYGTAEAALNREASLTIVDVGCGIGGSVRFLAREFPNSSVKGITLSTRQVERGNALNADAGLDSSRVKLLRGDAMSMPFEDNSVDLLWSLESAEHYPDKLQFLREVSRVLKPNGRFMMAAWCHRACPPKLDTNDLYILSKIYKKYCISHMCALEEFENHALRVKLRGVRTQDWSQAVRPFWRAVLVSAATATGVQELLRIGRPAIESALAVRHMIEGFRRGTLVFGVLAAFKPTPQQLQLEDDRLAELTCRTSAQ